MSLPLYRQFARKFEQNVENLLAVVVRRLNTPLLKFPNTYVSAYLSKQASSNSRLLYLVREEGERSPPQATHKTSNPEYLAMELMQLGEQKAYSKLGSCWQKMQQTQYTDIRSNWVYF